MKILVACEFSGTVRDAFAKFGHDAWSCDLLPSSTPGNHLQQDIFTPDGVWNLPYDFDLAIFHPPCTHLAVSGAAWFAKKQKEQREAICFFMACYNAPIARIAVENPVCIMSTKFRKPDQIIHPYQFGHAERKTTCLWLRNLPKLSHTCDVKSEMEAKPKNKQNPLHYLPPSDNRWALRSKTYPGFAAAMAEQWGQLTK